MCNGVIFGITVFLLMLVGAVVAMVYMIDMWCDIQDLKAQIGVKHQKPVESTNKPLSNTMYGDKPMGLKGALKALKCDNIMTNILKEYK